MSIYSSLMSPVFILTSYNIYISIYIYIYNKKITLRCTTWLHIFLNGLHVFFDLTLKTDFVFYVIFLSKSILIFIVDMREDSALNSQQESKYLWEDCSIC